VAIAERADDHEQAGLLLLQAGFHVHAVGPQIHELAVRKVAPLPGVVVDLPPGLEPGDG
jgi:hypothetical protein